MVLVFLNTMQFEAEKFESRTLPTPNMKGKEMIYWIRVRTPDKRLATELQSFLKNTTHIELRVPSAFIVVQAELENYRASSQAGGPEERESQEIPQRLEQQEKLVNVRPETPQDENRVYSVEIILRRDIPEESAKRTQSPYG